MIVENEIKNFGEEFESLLEHYNKKRHFSLDITLTDNCNFSCSYCFENKGNRKNAVYIPERMIAFINSLIEDRTYNRYFNNLALNFWGGEPTLRYGDILTYIEAFYDKPVSFFIYTNGSRRKALEEIVEKVKSLNCLDRFHVQVSWDGNPLHDLHRIGECNSKQIVKNIEYLVSENVNLDLKATIIPRDFSRMIECWESYKELNERLNQNFHYSPTIDQQEYKAEYLEEFADVLSNICFREIEYIRKYGKPLLSWFGEMPMICSYLNSMLCADIYGDLYPCHGVLYAPIKSEERIGNISDNGIIQKYFSEMYIKDYPEEKENCKECSATYCAICQVQNAVRSEKIDRYERWYDKPLTERCRYYKLFGMYDKALHRIMSNIVGEITE